MDLEQIDPGQFCLKEEIKYFLKNTEGRETYKAKHATYNE